jgi:AraC-like DNA-binding protein
MAGFRVRTLDALRMVPHPAVTLLLEFGAGSPVVDDAAGRQQRGSVVAGPGIGSGGAVWARGENVECVQVRLSPVIARAVLDASPADLDGAAVSLGDLWGPETSRIREQLGDVSSWQDRFALTEALLARRHEAGPPVDPEVAWAWHRIVGSRGLVRVDGLAAEVGWSRKRLWSRFRSQLGLPPKRAVKLVRFDHAAHRLVGVKARPTSRPTPATPTSPICIGRSWSSPGQPPRPWPASRFSPLTTWHGPAAEHPPHHMCPGSSGSVVGRR